jgi:hypothetical protein
LVAGVAWYDAPASQWDLRGDCGVDEIASLNEDRQGSIPDIQRLGRCWNEENVDRIRPSTHCG